MKFALRFVSSTSAFFELENNLPYYAPASYDVLLDGQPVKKGVTVNTFSLFRLTPGTTYTVALIGTTETTDTTDTTETTETTETAGTGVTIETAETTDTVLDGFTLTFTTRTETACLHAADFATIQTALNACPPGGRVYVPEGQYQIGPLLLGSEITLELAAGAVLRASTNRNDYPIWPGEIPCGPEGQVLQCASWEGEPRSCYQSILSAHHKHDIAIVGEGVIDGDAQNGDWWFEPKKHPIGRPRMLFVNDCERVVMHGVTVRNAPAWNLHPFFSRDLGFYDLTIEAPKDSPNTDGCDPESCDRVEIIGVRFSVGDDAIAIKSGKIYMGAKYKQPASRHVIRNCLMEYAHGGVVLGSEIAGGVRDLTVRQCFFDHTDRGLRIKTRRGRGCDCVVDGVTFDRITMQHVLTPLVINMYYDRDPEGVCEYVWSRTAAPVDERTPYLGRFCFKNLTCTDYEYAAAYFDGLPEQPIGEIVLENIRFTANPNAGAGYPAMMTHIDEHTKRGLIFKNVAKVVLTDVCLTGAEGEAVTLEQVAQCTGEVQ